jgi:hypothetical protein
MLRNSSVVNDAMAASRQYEPTLNPNGALLVKQLQSE